MNALGSHLSEPVVGVWSPAYASISRYPGFSVNITDLSLTPPNQFTVSVNITEVDRTNGYEFNFRVDRAILKILEVLVNDTTIFPSSQRFCPDGPTCSVISPNSAEARVTVAAFPPFFTGSGILAYIRLEVIAFGAGTLDLDRVNLSRAGVGIPLQVEVGLFRNIPEIPPVADFTFKPARPQKGELITFNATSSFDPEAPPGAPAKGIVNYNWSFRDGNTTNTNQPIIKHVFKSTFGDTLTGSFDVTLTVTDEQGLKGVRTRRVVIGPADTHDIALAVFTLNPENVQKGGSIEGAITVANQGTFNETFDLLVKLRTTPFTTFVNSTGQPLPVGQTRDFTFTIQTGNLAFGLHELEAAATLLAVDDNDPSDNQRTEFFQVLATASFPTLFIGVGGAVVAAGGYALYRVIARRRQPAPEQL